MLKYFFYFVLDNKIISGIEDTITEPDWKKHLYELDLKWDLFIGCSLHFNSRCAYRKSVEGWENLLKAVVMNEFYL
jgi:hypothetical protein